MMMTGREIVSARVEQTKRIRVDKDNDFVIEEPLRSSLPFMSMNHLIILSTSVLDVVVVAVIYHPCWRKEGEHRVTTRSNKTWDEPVVHLIITIRMYNYNAQFQQPTTWTRVKGAKKLFNLKWTIHSEFNWDVRFPQNGISTLSI